MTGNLNSLCNTKVETPRLRALFTTLTSLLDGCPEELKGPNNINYD